MNTTTLKTARNSASNHEQEETFKMKQFNKTFTVIVEVDTVAKHLLSLIDPDAKHREMIVEAIIATGVNNGTLHYLHNALNGFTNRINFSVGDQVFCNAKEICYTPAPDAPRDYQLVGHCEVVDIDEYSDRKLQVHIKYTDFRNNNEGREREELAWVSHTNCSLIAHEDGPVLAV